MYKKLKTYFIGGCMSSLNSVHDKSRLTLLYNLTFAVLIIGVVSAIVSTFLGTYSMLIPSFANIFFSLLILYVIRWTKDFSVVAKIYFILLFILVFGNLIFNDGTMHVGAPFWIMLLNIAVMYIIGLYWGVAFIIASLGVFLFYLHYFFPYHNAIFPSLPEEVFYSVYYETFFALFLLGYIINTILQSSKASDDLLKKKNIELVNQNNEILLREEEKTVMLKEIHHRVKNNLQVITSLLRLQMHELNSDKEVEKFNDSINRIMTMALIHDRIYQTEEFSRVNLEEYFKGLSNDLMNSYQIHFNVDLSFKFEIEKIGLKSIVPLALIYNELFSNSLKHAFNNTDLPIINVSLSGFDDDYFLFTYEDNGSWRPSEGKSTFGRELIDSLTQQLDGEVNFSTTAMTKYSFKFKHLDLE